jgi:hypothetical protein
MNETEAEYQKQLYILIWYLYSDTDYSSTTRSDMLEGAIEGLGEKGLLSGEIHERGLRLVKEAYEGHPYQEKVIECLQRFTQTSE